MDEHRYSGQMIIDADEGQHGWEIVMRFDAESCEAAWTDLTDLQLIERGPEIGQAFVYWILEDRKRERHSEALRMVATEVHWFRGDDDGPPQHEESDPPGWVAFARLSDGTLAFPLGATVYRTREEAEAERPRIKYDNGHVYTERERSLS